MMTFKAAKLLKMLAALIVAVIAAFLFDLVFSRFGNLDEIDGDTLREIGGVTVEGVIVEYDGRAHGVIVSGTDSNDVISYSSDGSTWQSTELKFVDEGEYTVYVKIERSGYIATTLQGTVEIRSAIINGISSCNQRIIYDGNSHLPNLFGITDGDRVTYSIDGEEFSDNIEITGVGEYVVYYRVQRGFARYMDSCRVEIVPNIIATYYNEDSLDVVEITEETMYDVNGCGTLLGREFYADGDVLIFDGTRYKRINTGEKIYTLTINEQTVRVLGGVELEVHIRFDEFGAIISAEDKVITVPDVNYCEYVTGAELTHGSVIRLIDDAIIQLSYRREQEITVQNKYILYDGNEHCIIPNTDAAVKVKVNGEHTDTIPKYSEQGAYRYEFLFKKDGYLPKTVTAYLIIYPDIRGGYVLGNAVILIDGTNVLLNGTRTSLVLNNDGMKINGEVITVTDDGIIYKNELYSKTNGNNLVISIGDDTVVVSTGTATGLRFYIDKDRGYVYNAKNSEIFYEFDILSEVTEVRLNSEPAIDFLGSYYIGVSDFFLGFAWIELL